MAAGRITVKAVVDRKVLTAFLHKDPEAQQGLKEQAQSLKDAADHKAEAFRNTGNHFERTYMRKFRGGYQVINGDTFSFIIEFGSRNNPAYRPLTGAAREVFGGKFKETTKAAPEDG